MGKVFSIMPWRDLSATNDEAGWHSLQRLQRDVDTIFDRILQGSSTNRGLEPHTAFAPRLDIAESSEAYHLTAELPGVAEKDIDLEISDGILTLKGEKKSEARQEDKNYHRVERSYGSFQRSIALPSEVDEASIKARFLNGVLEIDLPKVKDQKPKSKKIEIASA